LEWADIATDIFAEWVMRMGRNEKENNIEEVPDAICAKKPATIAAIPFPQDDIANVRGSHSSGKPLFLKIVTLYTQTHGWERDELEFKTHLCSETIQDSKAEKRSDVDKPPKTLPSRSNGIEGICSRRLMMI
jgi:hypothetical protein